MKISKKILALILSLSVILSGFCIVTQASNEADNTPVPLSSKEFSVLKSFGFIGEDVATLNNDSEISRAQFVGTLFKVAGFSEAEYSAQELYFNDVTAENLYKDEIQYFYEAGLINGTSYKTFSPNNPITYKQAVKVILDVLGYKEYITKKYANVMDGYVAMAQKLELCQGFVIGNVDGPLTAQKTIKLLYNAGISRVFEPTYYTTDGDVSYNFTVKTPTLFEQNHKIYYSEGCMQSNGLVSLLDDKAPEDIATIDGVNYLLTGCDLTGLTGLHVQFFYKNENGIKKITWACASDKNNMIDIKATMLELDNPKYDIDTVVYKNSKNKSVELEIDYYDVDVIYNNTILSVYDDEDYIKPEMGYIRLVENDGDNGYDLVIVEEYRNAFITGASSIGPHVSNKYNEDINLLEYDNIVVYDDGKEITVPEIGKNTLVTYIADKSKKNIVIYVNKEMGREVLTGYSEENGKLTLEFESGTYQYSPSYANLDPAKYDKITPRPGKTYIYYLDREGNIAEIQEQNDDILQYAFVIEVYQDDSPRAPEGSAYFRFLLTNGNFVTAKSKKKMKILEGGQIVNKNGTGMDIVEDNRLWGTKLNDEEEVETFFVPQVVRITINSDGELAEWEFPYDNTQNEWGHDNEKFTLDHISTNNLSYITDGVYPIDQKYMIDGTTVCFVKITNLDVEEPYAVWSHTQVNLKGREIRVYDSNEKCVPAVISLNQEINLNYEERATQTAFLVDSIKHKKIDGEYVKHVCGYLAGVWTEYAEYREGVIPRDLKKGDIVKFTFYDNKIFDLKEYNINVLETTEPVQAGTETKRDNMIFSYLYSVGESTINVLTPDNLIGTYGRVYPTGFSPLTVIPVIVYDTRTGEITKIHPTSIAPMQSPDSNGEFDRSTEDMMILINRSFHQVNDILIVLK